MVEGSESKTGEVKLNRPLHPSISSRSPQHPLEIGVLQQRSGFQGPLPQDSRVHHSGVLRLSGVFHSSVKVAGGSSLRGAEGWGSTPRGGVGFSSQRFRGSKFRCLGERVFRGSGVPPPRGAGVLESSIAGCWGGVELPTSGLEV